MPFEQAGASEPTGVGEGGVERLSVAVELAVAVLREPVEADVEPDPTETLGGLDE